MGLTKTTIFHHVRYINILLLYTRSSFQSMEANPFDFLAFLTFSYLKIAFSIFLCESFSSYYCVSFYFLIPNSSKLTNKEPTFNYFPWVIASKLLNIVKSRKNMRDILVTHLNNCSSCDSQQFMESSDMKSE